jgi:hypothetical protein
VAALVRADVETMHRSPVQSVGGDRFAGLMTDQSARFVDSDQTIEK